MKEIRKRAGLNTEISQAELKSHLHYDPISGLFTVVKKGSRRLTVGSIAGTIKGPHVRIMVNWVSYAAHRLAWLYMTGDWPATDIDHKNGIGTDNRWFNLREATPSENLFNRGPQKNNKSGYKNVSWCKIMKRWVVRMRYNKKYITVGYFDDIETANFHAIAARLRFQGQFSVDKRE